MGAFLHVNLPFEIALSISIGEDEELFSPDDYLEDKYKPYFQLLYSKKRERITSIGDFKRTFYYQEIVFELKDKYFNEIKEMIKNFWNEVSNHPTNKNKSLINTSFLADFINKCYDGLQISKETIDELDDLLKCVDSNYFLRTEKLPEIVVYCGYPIEDRENVSSSLNCFSILMFWEKLGIERDLEEDFIFMTNEIKRKIAEKYKVAELLCVMGY
ncbi:MAG: hypothetical protein A2015_00645 [Spirochaetes bacterium GWF1_31_7]|nr:MAG: hypothetical protein A2Y30_03865 [Spirochaetes bacterium GWE1_32_154]OHD45182.1 MAG: hypothetical protein A2Y29_16035 [Spirochaetes bacterium GWE2_31_10]OHD51091.1 MAG: hypothetical protein A2015_00645 [Spirochaetes bacterium GWF1_31_7]OHD79616.1 MAG: hypothetical protein A2355_01750 [Spirochaetes bacterium RIFOXYB1_FULL_32_8]HBD94815.1 hypothetical protein [Spirochaetia bacterium]